MPKKARMYLKHVWGVPNIPPAAGNAFQMLDKFQTLSQSSTSLDKSNICQACHGHKGVSI